MADEAPRVLYAHHLPLVGGAAASLRGLLRALPQGTVTALLACPAREGEASEGLCDVEWRETPTWQPRWSPLPHIMLGQLRQREVLSRALRELAAVWEPDIIHANSWPAAVAALRGVRGSVPVIWHARDLLVREVVLTQLRGGCAAVISISEAVRRRLLAAGFAARTVHLVYNGIDPADLQVARSAQDIRAELGIPPAAPLILYVGQFVPWKRHDLLITALPEVLRKASEARLVLVGEEHRHGTAYLDRLRLLARERGVADRVRLLGYRSDVADLLNACDVYVHAADPEPFGRAILEAMCLGKPVVAPCSAGPAELIVDGVSGLLVEPQSPQALAEGIVRMLREPEFAQACGEGARRRAVTNFRADAMAEGVLNVYRKVLEREP